MMNRCFECGKIFENKLKLSVHIRSSHNMSMSEYRDKYNINKCKICGNSLWAYNKTGYCKDCFDPVLHSKNLWKKDSYRNEIIRKVSKPRRKGFGEEQSKRIIKWYKDNPNQREIRSKKMKESWENGKIVSNNYSCNKSKKQLALFLKIVGFCSDALSNYTIKCARRRWYFPDIFIPDDNLIVEYFGDYWHANPEYYKPNDVVHHGFTANEIWKKDKQRIEKLEDMGYRVNVVWGSGHEENPEEIMRWLRGLDWDSCAA